jgi:thiosulfate/3-mercaptopyruvate sulfurtransferase
MHEEKSPLINVEMLEQHRIDPAWVIIDCRFDLIEPTRGLALYKQGHIPGARYASLDEDLAGCSGLMDGRHPLPDTNIFSQTLAKLGISNTTHVVVYDDVGGAIAARFWWMLRWVKHECVYILDGGIQAWERKGLCLEKGQKACKSTSFSIASTRDEWVVGAEGVSRALAEGAVLLDARSEDRFSGKSEPIDPVSGHIPGAINFPFTRSLDPLGRLRKSEALREELLVYVDREMNLISMCGSGVTACHLTLAVKLAGFGDALVYIGSWSEWITDKNRGIAVGSEAESRRSK